MAEEVKTGNPMVKYLIFGIIGVISIIIVTGIAYGVSKRVLNMQKRVNTEELIIPEKATYDLDEFLVPTSDNNGIIKVKIRLGVSEVEVNEVIGQKLGLVRDVINKILVRMTAIEAINHFRDEVLEQEIKLALNKALRPYLGGGVYDGKVRKIVKVYFLDFLVQ